VGTLPLVGEDVGVMGDEAGEGAEGGRAVAEQKCFAMTYASGDATTVEIGARCSAFEI